MTRDLTHKGLPNGMTRWQFFGLIDAARQQLDLSKGAIAYLKVAISNTMDEDFAAGRICSFWTSVTKTAARARLKFSRPTGHELKDRYSIAYATAFRLRKYLVEDLSRPQGGILGQCVCTQEIEMPPDVDRGRAVYLQWLNDEVEIRRSRSWAQFSSIIE